MLLIVNLISFQHSHFIENKRFGEKFRLYKIFISCCSVRLDTQIRRLWHKGVDKLAFSLESLLNMYSQSPVKNEPVPKITYKLVI